MKIKEETSELFIYCFYNMKKIKEVIRYNILNDAFNQTIN